MSWQPADGQRKSLNKLKLREMGVFLKKKTCSQILSLSVASMFALKQATFCACKGKEKVLQALVTSKEQDLQQLTTKTASYP